MLACFCLNITIETAPNDFQKVTPESLGLSDEEKSDTFFKQDILKIGNLQCISKVHSCLVQKRNVGAWTISRCINCDCHTHAVHQKKGASMVVIYSKLLNSGAISSVKSTDIFSTIYNIIVNPNDIGLEDQRSDTYRYFPPLHVESSLRSIRDIMTEFIRKESIDVEQRIKKYTNDQYDKLNYWKDRAFKEHESLVKVIYSAIDSEPESTKKSSFGFITPTGSSSSRPAKLTETKHPGDFPYSYSSSATSSGKVVKTDQNSPSKGTDSDELIFEFESDEVNSMPSTDVDESDREDKEEGISIPRSTPARVNMAKSLPMNIPAFAKPRLGTGEEIDDASPVGENVDIAASIKALAKSVHGDPVFGDLPRPRFSTQI